MLVSGRVVESQKGFFRGSFETTTPQGSQPAEPCHSWDSMFSRALRLHPVRCVEVVCLVVVDQRKLNIYIYVDIKY